MTRLIDTSHDGTKLIVKSGFGQIEFHFIKGFKTPGKYKASDIKAVSEVDEEQFRSAGKAVIGAVVGGVLTGGIGLLAGAAFGGRRRKTGSYMVIFNDGHHVVFEETKGSAVKVLDKMIEKENARNAVAQAKLKPTETD
jgi:radical SAM superfamily enzyme with C-terminal helix-hairpin-helix motif